jgi:hypothetical protein
VEQTTSTSNRDSAVALSQSGFNRGALHNRKSFRRCLYILMAWKVFVFLDAGIVTGSTWDGGWGLHAPALFVSWFAWGIFLEAKHVVGHL